MSRKQSRYSPVDHRDLSLKQMNSKIHVYCASKVIICFLPVQLARTTYNHDQRLITHTLLIVNKLNLLKNYFKSTWQIFGSEPLTR